MAGNGTLRRARRLILLSAFAPPVLYDAYAVWWRLRDESFDGADVLQLTGLTAVFWLVGLWLVVLGRKRPSMWLYPAQIGGLVLLWLLFNLDEPSEQEQGLYWAGTAAAIAAIAAAALLPALRARKMVLANLSQDVIDSDLIISFKPRPDSAVNLEVDRHEITAFEEARGPDRLRVSVPIGEIAEVTTWTSAAATEWAVPGGSRTVSMPSGELLGFTVAGGQLVVAVEDAAKAKRFVEARRDLARHRTSAGSMDE